MGFRRLSQLAKEELQARHGTTIEKADEGHTWTSLLGWILGLAEAKLLSYAGDVPEVHPGIIPFDIEFFTATWIYTIKNRAVDEEQAQAWSIALKNGLWERLRPGDFVFSGSCSEYGERLIMAWYLLDEACHPERASLARQHIHYWQKGGWTKEGPVLWASQFPLALNHLNPSDPDLIAATLNYIFRQFRHAHEEIKTFGRYHPRERTYPIYEPLERGEPCTLEKYLF
jgi:hypothetical protein